MILKSACFILAVCTSVLPCLGQCTGRVQLSPYERNQFVSGYYGSRAEVYAQFLAVRGCEQSMLAALRHFGGIIRYSDEKAGYALVLLPKEKLLAVLDLPGIEYAFPSTDGRNYPDRESESAKEIKLAPVPPVSIPTPRVAMEASNDGPYFAAHEIGLDAFWKEHPDADGRGVTAVVLDEGLDLLHPALQLARDADGRVEPKIVDQVSFSAPQETANWVQLGGPIETQSGTFDAAGRTWTAPHDGKYRFGVYRQELVLGPQGNSHTKKLQLAVGVLVNEKRNRVWVDTNGDGSFRDERALKDFGVAQEIDWFGAKEGDDDNRIPFGVKIDSSRNAIFIGVAEGGHGAGIAGSLAANQLTGGLYDGAAPGAQLIDARDSRLMQLPAVLQLAARPDVAVISRSGGFARAGYDGRREGIEDFQRHVAERMVAVYDKEMACVCTADGLISVNDYVSGEMLRRNRRTSGPYVEAIHDFYSSSRNWGLVNGILAPSGQLNTESRYMPFGIEFADGKRHTFADDRFDPPAPAGYWIGANESPTIPVVSGVLTDLMSGARHEHLRYNTLRLNQAIFAGARLIDGIPTYEQGYGVVNAAGAWEQLVKMARADDPANPELTSFTFSHLEDGRTKEIDGYYREATTPGGELKDAIWVTRHGGFAGGREYRFSLRGDDGTYSLLKTKAKLRRDDPVEIRFRAKTTSGFHVSMLELTDAATGTVMQLVPLSVKVPDVPEVLGPGVDKYTATMAPRRDDSRLIYLEGDVQAVRYHLQIPYERDDADAYAPGIRGCGGTLPTGTPVDAAHHVGALDICDSIVANDHADFQYVGWENRAFHAEYETPYDPPAPSVPITGTVTVTKYAVAIERSSSGTMKVRNTLADIAGRIELFDATISSDQLTGTGTHASAEKDIRLPASLAQWRMRITSGSALSEPADVYLLNCSGKEGCSVAAQHEISSSGGTLTIEKPQEGDWRIVVRSRSKVLRPTTYTVHEALLVAGDPIEPDNSNHRSGETWTLPLPAKRKDAQYAAFRIRGTPGGDREKDGLLIAMTPLDPSAP